MRSCLIYAVGRAAEKMFIRALEMRESVLSNDHPDVAQSLNNLASLYNDQGRWDAILDE